MPERFLKDGKLVVDGRDPAMVAFGFGRRCARPPFPSLPITSVPTCLPHRICPGRHFATSALFIFMASVLHTFNITAPVDEQGRPVRNGLRATTGLISFV